MSATNEQATELREAIDQIEEAYEFMLAYAAQGRQSEADTEGSSQIRGYLDRFRSALDTLSALTSVVMPAGSPGHAFSDHFSHDTTIMKSIVDLLTDCDNISSDMIDNTNGLIAVRSFLTDVFFIDQVLLPRRPTT